MTVGGPLTAYVGLGSNLGDKKANITQALTLLEAAPETKLLRVAPFYRTAPVGYPKQDWFVNTVAELASSLPPQELLDLLLALEAKIGRVRQERWGPRLIDLDLLLFGQLRLTTPTLTLPHPRMHQRAFVMAPLADLAPNLAIPGQGQAAALARQLRQEQEVELLKG